MRNFTKLIWLMLLFAFSTSVVFAQSSDKTKIDRIQDVDPKASAIAPATDFLFDFQFDWPLVNPDNLSVGIETDGNFIYTAHWQNSTIYRYDMDGLFIETFDIGAANIRDLAYNPTNGYFYGAAANTDVFEMDFTQGAEALVSTIVAPTDIRGIGHMNVGGVDYLFGNNWSSDVYVFDLAGVESYHFAVSENSYYGFAYDDYSTGGPYIWGHAQMAAGSREFLVQMDAATGAETGLVYDVGTALGHPDTDLAGGLAITPPGTFPSVDPTAWSFFGITQNTSMWAIELGEPNSCSTPIALSATNIGDESADLAWTETGVSTSWEVEYGVTGFTQGTGTIVAPATNPQAVTGLTTLTTYDFYVRADCGGGDYSAWSPPSTFTTTGGDCMWECIGVDSYGDGWNGASIDFVVDGSIVANWAGPADFGPESYFFPIFNPSVVDIVWNVGSYDSEVSFEIFDNLGNLMFSDGPYPVGTTGLVGSCGGIPDAPTVAAPMPTQDDEDVISIFSDTYTDLEGTNFNPGWGQTTLVTFENIGDNEMMKYAAFNYQGTELGGPQDLSSMEFMHVDIWTADATVIQVSPISATPPIEFLVSLEPINLGSWNSYEIPLTDFTDVSMADIFQLKFDGQLGVNPSNIYLDNIYFYKVPVLPGETCENALDYGMINDPTVYSATTEAGDVEWYSFTLDADYSNVAISLCGSSFDTKLEIWAACDDVDYIGYSDDYDCAKGMPILGGTKDRALQSQVDFDALQAGTYFAKVYGYGSAYGDIILNITGETGGTLDPPTDFMVTDQGYGTWTAPGGGGGTSEWLLYDVDVMGFSGIGAEAADYSLTWASKWTPEQLADYGTGYVTEVAVYQLPSVGDYLTEVRILSGDGTTILYTQDVTGTLIGDQWNTITLDEAVEFDNTENLWIAMYVERPGGTANEPTSDVIEVMTERYDYFSYNGAPWTSIFGEYGIDNQGWMLRGFVTTEAGKQIALGQGTSNATDYSNAVSIPTGKGMISAEVENTKFPKALLGYNLYLDYVMVGTTADLFYQYADLTAGETYMGGVAALYDEGESAIVDYEFTVAGGGGDPIIGVIPEGLVEIHDTPPEITTQTLYISNTGTESLMWDITVATNVIESIPPPFDPVAYARLQERMLADGLLNSPANRRAVSNNTSYVPTTNYDPMAVVFGNRDMVFAYNAYDATGALVEGPIIFDLETPGTITQLAPTSSGDFIAGACMADGVWYGAQYGGGLYTIDTETGVMTMVGASPDCSGLAYDGSTMYGATITDLYSIDMATGEGTMIGALGTTGGVMIGIGCNAAGELYGFDLGDDTFYSIDKATGAATAVGSLGIDVSYAQDMSFDKATDICYLSAYTTTGSLYTVDVATGATTFVGDFAGGAEVTGFAIPGAGITYANDVDVAGILSPNSGMLLGMEDVIVKVKNLGENSQSDIPFEVSVDGAIFYSGTVAGPLAMGESVEVACGTIDMSAAGTTWEFEACTMMVGDENPDNDCKSKTVTHLEATYCDASTSNEDEIIGNVLCGAIDNASGWQGGVADYTAMSTVINAGESEAITVANTGNPYASDLVTVWVDWNDDFEFSLGSNEEFILTNVGGTGATFEGVITAPADAIDGDHRMRVRMTWSTAPDPCGNASYGEVEDYTVTTGGGQPSSWLSVSTTSGTVDPGMTQEVVVTFNSEDMDYGLYNGLISVASNDPVNPLVEVPVEFILEGGCNPPEYWTVNPADFQFNGEVTAQVFFDDIAVENGTLAAFVGDECRGVVDATYFPAEEYYIFTVICYSNMASGETLSFEYFDPITCEICELDASVEFIADMIEGTAVNPLVFNCGGAVTAIVDLAEGWTWFSLNVEGDDMSIDNALSSLTLSDYDYIKNQTSSATYYEGSGWFGALEVIDPAEMYQINLLSVDVLEFTGLAVDLAMPINLNAGWTWIGYLPQVELDINMAMSSLSLDTYDYIKNQTGSATYYEGTGWFGALETLSPYDGYKINLANADVLTYPTETMKSASQSELPIFGNNTGVTVNPYSYEFNGTVTARVFNDSELSNSEDDMLLAYVGDECRGISKALYFEPTDEFAYQLMIFSNIVEGETITFKYFDSQNNELYECIETIKFANDMVMSDAFNALDLNTKSALGINTTLDYAAFNVYPNPSSGITTIDYTLKSTTNVRIVVSDIYGKQIQVVENQIMNSGTYSTSWNAGTHESGTYFIKIISDDSIQIRKVLLMN